MPWMPELFTAPAFEHMLETRQRDELATVPYFDGLLADEPTALVESFAGEPLVHDPVRGRIKGVEAFAAYVAEMRAWLRERRVTVEDVERVVGEELGFGEVVLHLAGEGGRCELPYAVVAERRPDRRIEELRLYYSARPLTGRHVHRLPLLQARHGLRVADVLADYERALAAGDADAIVATFEPDGYARAAAGAVHRGPDALRDFYAPWFSDGGGVPLEHCAIVDDGQTCALEYNVVQSQPQAGFAVFVRGQGGSLVAARIYDDAPLSRAA